MNDFIFNNCNESIANNLTSVPAVNQILLSMNQYQIERDDLDLLGADRDEHIALAFDGATHGSRSTKIFFGKGWQSGSGSVTKYIQTLDGKKQLMNLTLRRLIH